MNKILAVLAAFAMMLFFGCIGGGTPLGATSFDKATTFTAMTNNSTSDVYALNTVLTTHAYSYGYNNNWTNGQIANVSLQGSIDGVQWIQLSSVQGSTNGTSFITGSPIMYVRAVITAWNATVNNSSAASLTVRYIGTG